MAADEPDLTAAELALGLLDGDERAAAMRRVLAEPGFAAEVAWWRDALAPLFAAWPEMAPPAELETRVMAAIDGGSTGTVAASDDGAARRWRVIATALAACLVAAIALLVVLRQPPAPLPPPTTVAPTTAAPTPVAAPPLLAAIVPNDGKGAALAAAYDAASGEIRLSGAPDVPASRVAELWVIGKDATPRSLGLLRSDGATRLALAEARRGYLADGVTLAVSIEPTGGSPTGLPTGPVVATGTLLRA